MPRMHFLPAHFDQEHRNLMDAFDEFRRVDPFAKPQHRNFVTGFLWSARYVIPRWLASLIKGSVAVSKLRRAREWYSGILNRLPLVPHQRAPVALAIEDLQRERSFYPHTGRYVFQAATLLVPTAATVLGVVLAVISDISGETISWSLSWGIDYLNVALSFYSLFLVFLIDADVAVQKLYKRTIATPLRESALAFREPAAATNYPRSRANRLTGVIASQLPLLLIIWLGPNAIDLLT